MSADRLMDPLELKKSIREQAHANRKAQENKDELSQDICEKFAGLAEFQQAECVMAYLDVRAEVFDSLAPAVNRLGVEFPSLDAFLAMLQQLPMFAGRWSEYLTRYFTYDVEPGPCGGVRSKVARHAVEEEVANLARTRLWVWHHRITAPTLLLRAPDGLLTATDCLMTQEEAEAMAHAIPDCRLVVVPGANHYTILLGAPALVRREVAAFLERAQA